jgi:hypothetical protein
MLLVGNLGACTGKKESEKISSGFRGQRRFAQALHLGVKVVSGEDIDASLLASGEDETVSKLISKPSGKNDATFVVKLGGVRSQKHFAPLSCTGPTEAIATLLHFAPNSTTLGKYLSYSAPPLSTLCFRGEGADRNKKTGP